MKKLAKTIVASGLVTISSAALAAGWEVSGNVALATDYVFRGISQTTSDPAIQGGFDAVHDSGFYTGVWGSNVQFAGSLELDYYAGFGSSINEQASYDVGVIYYDYPGGNLGGGVDPEYWELYGGLSYDFGKGSVSGKISYSPDYFGETDTGVYYEAGVDVPLPQGFALATHVGYQTINEGAASKGGFFSSEEDSYKDWKIGISKEYAGLGFDVSAKGTNLDGKDCFNLDICDTTVILTVSKSL